jgi:hypothetical protein
VGRNDPPKFQLGGNTQLYGDGAPPVHQIARRVVPQFEIGACEDHAMKIRKASSMPPSTREVIF